MRIKLGKKCNLWKSHDALFVEGLKIKGFFTFFSIEEALSEPLGVKKNFKNPTHRGRRLGIK